MDKYEAEKIAKNWNGILFILIPSIVAVITVMWIGNGFMFVLKATGVVAAIAGFGSFWIWLGNRFERWLVKRLMARKPLYVAWRPKE